MEKSKGRVRNFVVSNRDLFCDMLARTLCKMQVQYVQIENEFHCMDKILRFYTFDEGLELFGKVDFVGFEEDKIMSLDPQSLLFTKSKDELSDLLIDSQQEFERCDDAVCYFGKSDDKKNFTRQRIQQENKSINQKIKQSGIQKRMVQGYRRQVYKKY